MVSRLVVEPLRRATKLSLILLLLTFATACKLVITVPEGGKVVTEDGFVCLAGETCVIEVTDDSFDSTFTAMPDAGYTFTIWAPKFRAFCRYNTTPCRLSTDGFAENAKLVDVLASNMEFHLQPVFVAYDVGFWRKTVREINEGSFATENFLYATAPDVAGCDPGAVKAQVNNRALEATNQTRALHRLPEVDHEGTYDMQVQESSLVQRANNYLNHTPSPGDACYTANAREGAETSNLGSGSRLGDPAADVIGWTNDNENLAARMEAGHRRWMLFPELGYIAYGQVDGYKTLKVFGFDKPPRLPVPADLEYVAMPHRYYPYPFVSKDPPTPWGLSMVPPNGVDSAFDYFSSAQVEVSEKDTGNSLPIKNLHRDSKRFGLANFLSWDVDGWDYDVEYLVKVTNVKLPGGDMRDVEYPVVVDRYNLFNVNHPRESTDSKSGTTLQGNFNTAEDQDSYFHQLQGRYRVSDTQGFPQMGYFIRLYDKGKRLIRSSDEPFEIELPLGIYTIVVSPCNEAGGCYQGRNSYSVAFTSLK